MQRCRSRLFTGTQRNSRNRNLCQRPMILAVHQSPFICSGRIVGPFELTLNLLLAYLENFTQKECDASLDSDFRSECQRRYNCCCTKHHIRPEIQRTWRRFNAQEVESLIDNQDVFCKLSKKYRLGHFQSKQIDEDVARGRQF